MKLPRWFPYVLGGAGLAGLGALLWPVGKQRRVALVGDSLAVGLTPYLQKLAAASGTPFHGEGHVGSTCATWLANPSWGAWVPGFAPTQTLIVLGTNQYLDPAPKLSEFKAIAAKSPGAIWVQPPTLKVGPATAVRAVIRQVGVPVIEEMTVPLGADGVHPTPSGFATWAAAIWRDIS